MTTQRKNKRHRNLVAKFAKYFNKSKVQQSDKKKLKHNKPKHKNRIDHDHS